MINAAMWVLVLYVGPGNVINAVDYPAYDFRAFKTEKACEIAKAALEQGIGITRFDPAEKLMCVYEADWLTNETHQPWKEKPWYHFW